MSFHESFRGIGDVAYGLGFPSELAAVHPGFHVSMDIKSIQYLSLVVPVESINVKYSLSYEEIPIKILDHQVWRLRKKNVASVKVLWQN